MRYRPLWWAIVFLSAFVWVTSQAKWSLRNLAAPMFRAGLSWSEPQRVRGAGLQPDEQTNIDIYRTAKAATVYVTSTTVKRDWFYQPYATQSLGSGFLVNDDGFILTNFHVVSGSARLQVTLEDQSQYTARALDIDRSDDLALIKIEPKKKLPFLHLGDSDHLQVGQKVLAIGNPFGLEGTLTVGVVSSIGRSIQSERTALKGMIQTDAAINGGNSGGPLLDSSGDVIGINTAILGETNLGIGFALPINRAKALLSDYKAGRITERPRVGITTQYVAGDLADALHLPTRGGLLIQNIGAGSSEAAAGLRGATELVTVGNSELGINGDLIIAIDGQPVAGEDGLVKAYSHRRVGDTLTLTIVRHGRTMQVPMKLLSPVGDDEQ